MSSEAQRLEDVMYDAAMMLVATIGLPGDDPEGPRSFPHIDNGGYVDRQQVPEVAWRAACQGLNLLMVGIGVLDTGGPVISPEEGLSMLNARKDETEPDR